MPVPAARRPAVDRRCLGPRQLSHVRRAASSSRRRDFPAPAASPGAQLRWRPCARSSSPEPGGTRSSRSRSGPTPLPTGDDVLLAGALRRSQRRRSGAARGRYPAPPGSPPDIPGIETAGTVIARGPTARRFEIGDRVFGIVGGGGLADRVRRARAARRARCRPNLDDVSGSGRARRSSSRRTTRSSRWPRSSLGELLVRHRRERRRRHGGGPDRGGGRARGCSRPCAPRTSREPGRRARRRGDRPEDLVDAGPGAGRRGRRASSSSGRRTSRATSRRSG